MSDRDYPYLLGQAGALLRMTHETLLESKVYPESLKEAVEKFFSEELTDEP